MTISYANNREDILLARAFGSDYVGFYVDVGASYPERESVTKLFYDRGWSGINIEPAGHPFAALERERERDINLNVGISDTEGEATFYEYDGEFSARSTFRDELTEHYRSDEAVEPSSATVAVTTLATVWAEHVGDRVVDFLKIDVEGAEAAALRGADFARFRPRVVVVEATEPGSPEPSHHEWEPLLLDADYRLALFDGLNRIYVDVAEPALSERLSVPVNVFDAAEPVAVAALQERLRLTHIHAAALESENAQLTARLDPLREERDQLAREREHLFAAVALATRDGATARALVADLRGQLEDSQTALAAAVAELDAARIAGAAAERQLARLARHPLARLIALLPGPPLQSAPAFAGAEPPVAAVAGEPGSSPADGYDRPMSWKVTARRLLGWPLRRLLNPRFEAVAAEIHRTRGITHAEAEATRQLSAAIERSISEAIEQNTHSVIEVAAGVGDRLDRAMAMLERIEARLDAAESAQTMPRG